MHRSLSIAIIGVIAACVAGAPRDSRAEFQDGNSFYETCSDPGDEQAMAYCVGYAAAIADVLGKGNEDIAHWYACIPPDATQGDVLKKATQWLAEHPDNRGASGAHNMAQAMAKAYPCDR